VATNRSAFVLVNPVAGRGRGGRRLAGYLSLLRRYLGPVEPAVTAHPGDETMLVDRALSIGFDTIVAIGGDGTFSAVADRVVRSGRRDVAVGLLPAGTGNDFGKSLGIVYERAESVVKAIAERRTLTVDVGRVEGRTFVNVVGFGFDIAVIDDSAGVPLLKGDILYRFSALRQLFRFPGIEIGVSTDGAPAEMRMHLMLIVANARIFGGSFQIAPGASLQDGLLDVVSVFNAGPIRRMQLFGRASGGTHVGEPEVEIRQAPSCLLSFREPVRYEVDGEVYLSKDRSITIENVPGALTVLVPEPVEKP
jgi:diacylglycerol kinase (ATP)